MALLHELGHLAALLLIGASGNMRAHVSGFRLNCQRLLSYKEEIFVSLSGPLINLLLAAVILFLPFNNGYLTDVFVISLLTAISNLLPIEGHDGERILRISLLSSRKTEGAAIGVCSSLSFILSAFFAIFSLYLILRGDLGYWIYIVFSVFLVKKIKSDRQTFLRENKRK
jgi:Zn-dependent protease